jgi:hypothetical protein
MCWKVIPTQGRSSGSHPHGTAVDTCVQPAADAVDAIKTDEGNLLCVVREDGLSLINALENIKGYIGNRLPLISGVDSADVSLMNLVKANYDFEPQDVSVIIYVGTEFTRLIFMRGEHFHQFAPIIGEGTSAESAEHRLLSVAPEQDNLAIRIFAGSSLRANAAG